MRYFLASFAALTPDGLPWQNGRSSQYFQARRARARCAPCGSACEQPARGAAPRLAAGRRLAAQQRRAATRKRPALLRQLARDPPHVVRAAARSQSACAPTEYAAFGRAYVLRRAGGGTGTAWAQG